MPASGCSLAFEDSQQNAPQTTSTSTSTGNFNVYQGKIDSNGDLNHSGDDNTFEDVVELFDVYVAGGNGILPGAGEPHQDGVLGELAGNPRRKLRPTGLRLWEPLGLLNRPAPSDPDGPSIAAGSGNIDVPSDAALPEC